MLILCFYVFSTACRFGFYFILLPAAYSALWLLVCGKCFINKLDFLPYLLTYYEQITKPTYNWCLGAVAGLSIKKTTYIAYIQNNKAGLGCRDTWQKPYQNMYVVLSILLTCSFPMVLFYSSSIISNHFLIHHYISMSYISRSLICSTHWTQKVWYLLNPFLVTAFSCSLIGSTHLLCNSRKIATWAKLLNMVTQPGIWSYSYSY